MEHYQFDLDLPEGEFAEKPRLNINLDYVIENIKEEDSVRQAAKRLNCSEDVIYRRLKYVGIESKLLTGRKYERAELVLEALQLRELGYTQQAIAEGLGVPLRTLQYWFQVAGTTNENVACYGNGRNISEVVTRNIKPSTITLYPCKNSYRLTLQVGP